MLRRREASGWRTTRRYVPGSSGSWRCPASLQWSDDFAHADAQVSSSGESPVTIGCHGCEEKSSIAGAVHWQTDFLPRSRSIGPTPAMSRRSEEHTSELQSLMLISYVDSCLTKKYKKNRHK